MLRRHHVLTWHDDVETVTLMGRTYLRKICHVSVVHKKTQPIWDVVQRTNWYLCQNYQLNSTQRERRQKDPPTSFSSVTSINVIINLQNFLTFSFNSFVTQNGKAMPIITSKLLKFNQEHCLKSWFFLWNSYKIEAMITSLIEILELLNFGHMTLSTI